MLLKYSIAQTKFLLKQKGALVPFYILLALALVNFTGNVAAFHGRDVVNMYHPMKLLLLSYNRTYHGADIWLTFIQLYPLLVVCPAGFSLARERQTGQDVLMAARMGNLRYRISKLIAAALTTFIVFSVPFFIEILLNCIAFPLSAQGDLLNFGIYNSDYIASTQNYLFYHVYWCSSYLYAVLGTFFFGLVSGLMGAFTAAFSSVFKIKYRITLFLPVFLLLNASLYLSDIANDFSVEWYHYLMLFDEMPKSAVYCAAVLSILLIGSILGVIWGGKQDCIR